jgi:hypothetical protein
VNIHEEPRNGDHVKVEVAEEITFNGESQLWAANDKQEGPEDTMTMRVEVHAVVRVPKTGVGL